MALCPYCLTEKDGEAAVEVVLAHFTDGVRCILLTREVTSEDTYNLKNGLETTPLRYYPLALAQFRRTVRVAVNAAEGVV